MVQTETFCALVLDQDADGAVSAKVKSLALLDLYAAEPPGADITVRVLYSTLNFKDGLALKGDPGVVKSFPHVPGVDLVGIVEQSDSDQFAIGDTVISTAFRVGEIYWGGYAQKARLCSAWLVKLPEGLSPKRAMAIGTAGLTAMEAIIALEEHGLLPGNLPGNLPENFLGGQDESGEVLVTGAAGGVGSIAVAVLANLGYRVTAATGRKQTHDYLRSLGANTLIARSELSSRPTKALLSRRWAGAVDTVGGDTLATVIASLKEGASVAATGNVAGSSLSTSVMPFILRGVNLLGIEATVFPIERRRRAWARLSRDLPLGLLDEMTTLVSLGQVVDWGEKIRQGEVQGRLVIDVNG